MAVDYDKGMRPNLYELMQGGGGGGSYVLPIASSDTLGGVKIGDGIEIDAEGTISAESATPYELPTASADVLGGVKIGSGIDVDGNGVISADIPTPIDTYTKSEIDALVEDANPDFILSTVNELDNFEVPAGQRRLAVIRFNNVPSTHALIQCTYYQIINASESGTMSIHCVAQDTEAFTYSNKIQIPVVNVGTQDAKIKIQCRGLFAKKSQIREMDVN